MNTPLEEILWEKVEKDKTLLVYALLDGARSLRIHPNLILSDNENICLYEGKLPRELEEAAPYVTRLRKQETFTHWLLRESWNQSWGLFFLTHAPLMEVRRHFRTLLKVKTEDHGILHFRFYDPRVLRIFLPTCNGEELKAVFGPVDPFYIEAGDGKNLREFSRDGDKLVDRLRPLRSEPLMHSTPKPELETIPEKQKT